MRYHATYTSTFFWHICTLDPLHVTTFLLHYYLGQWVTLKQWNIWGWLFYFCTAEFWSDPDLWGSTPFRPATHTDDSPGCRRGPECRRRGRDRNGASSVRTTILENSKPLFDSPCYIWRTFVKSVSLPDMAKIAKQMAETRMVCLEVSAKMSLRAIFLWQKKCHKDIARENRKFKVGTLFSQCYLSTVLLCCRKIVWF